MPSEVAGQDAATEPAGIADEHHAFRTRHIQIESAGQRESAVPVAEIQRVLRAWAKAQYVFPPASVEIGHEHAVRLARTKETSRHDEIVATAGQIEVRYRAYRTEWSIPHKQGVVAWTAVARIEQARPAAA